jgi:hypothetical protein
MSWKRYNEAIEILRKRHRYFPSVFRWRGRRYFVQQVEECWTVSRQGWRGRVDRHFFRVSCNEGRFELYQDLRLNTWHLGRARLTPASRPAVWHTATNWDQRGA